MGTLQFDKAEGRDIVSGTEKSKPRPPAVARAAGRPE